MILISKMTLFATFASIFLPQIYTAGCDGSFGDAVNRIFHK